MRDILRDLNRNGRELCPKVSQGREHEMHFAEHGV